MDSDEMEQEIECNRIEETVREWKNGEELDCIRNKRITQNKLV